MRPHKGQVAVMDLFVAVLIFGIIVASVMFAWNNYNQKIEKQLDFNTDLIKAYHISDLLVRYPGKPSAWERHIDLGEDIVSTIGLSSRDRVISNDKLEKFLEFDYDYIKDRLNINEYDFYFRMTNLDGSDFSPVIEKGQKVDESVSVVLKRYILYNGEEAILEFWLQREE